MRQLLNDKKVKKLKEKTGLPIVKVMVRGGSHSKLLCLDDGSCIWLDTDGTMEKSDMGWNINAKKVG